VDIALLQGFFKSARSKILLHFDRRSVLHYLLLRFLPRGVARARYPYPGAGLLFLEKPFLGIRILERAVALFLNL
jgi:hypothetical protein